MKQYEITTTTRVTDEDIDDLLVTAFEGGITYWCDAVRVIEEPSESYEFASEVLTRGGMLELHDAEEFDDETEQYGKWYVLTMPMLLKALSDVSFDFDDYDAGDADTVIQKAIFGGIVYG